MTAQRLGLAGFILAVAAALAADALLPAGSPSGTPVAPEEAGGILACPVARAVGGRGSIHLLGLGRGEAAVRVTLVPDEGQPEVVRRAITPGEVGTISVDEAVDAPAGAIIQYAGASVVASASVRPSGVGPRGGRAAAACDRPGPGTVAAVGASTLDAETWLALLNPGASDAVVDVTLVAREDIIRSERLRQRVVPGGGRLLLRLSDFAFDRGNLAAVVHMRTGRVVAAAFVTGARGNEIIPAVAPSETTVAMAGAARDQGVLEVLASGEERSTPVAARLLSGEARGRLEGFPPEVPPLSVARHDLPAEPESPVAVELAAGEGTPVVAALRWRVRTGAGHDLLTTVGAPAAKRWATAVASPEGDPRVLRTLVANPGDEPARVRVRGAGQAAEIEEEMVIEGGRVAAVEIGGAGRHGVVVDATHPVVVALEGVGTGPAVRAFAFTASPLVDPPTVAVRHDPRAGVPAPLRQTAPDEDEGEEPEAAGVSAVIPSRDRGVARRRSRSGGRSRARP